jgi:hypothetical protein
MPAATQERTYNLGKVAPHVQAAADLLGNMFGIRTIGGYRAHGSVPNSDHPKGLAGDFMTSSKAVGDKLAAYAVRNYKALGITYVIWWRRIWTPSRGWHDYSGPSDHTDHVHLSFSPKAGSGKVEGGGTIGAGIGNVVTDALNPIGIGDGIKGVADQLKTIGGALMSVGKVAELATSLFLPNNLVRAASALAGSVFILIGIFFLAREVRNG